MFECENDNELFDFSNNATFEVLLVLKKFQRYVTSGTPWLRSPLLHSFIVFLEEIVYNSFKKYALLLKNKLVNYIAKSWFSDLREIKNIWWIQIIVFERENAKNRDNWSVSTRILLQQHTLSNFHPKEWFDIQTPHPDQLLPHLLIRYVG